MIILRIIARHFMNSKTEMTVPEFLDKLFLGKCMILYHDEKWFTFSAVLSF